MDGPACTTWRTSNRHVAFFPLSHDTSSSLHFFVLFCFFHSRHHVQWRFSFDLCGWNMRLLSLLWHAPRTAVCRCTSRRILFVTHTVHYQYSRGTVMATTGHHTLSEYENKAATKPKSSSTVASSTVIPEYVVYYERWERWKQ